MIESMWILQILVNELILHFSTYLQHQIEMCKVIRLQLEMKLVGMKQVAEYNGRFQRMISQFSGSSYIGLNRFYCILCMIAITIFEVKLTSTVMNTRIYQLFFPTDIYLIKGPVQTTCCLVLHIAVCVRLSMCNLDFES